MEMLQLRKSTMFFSVLDMVILMLYIFTGFPLIGVLFLGFPMLGYFGAKGLNSRMVLGYLVWCYLNLIIRVVSLVALAKDNTVAGIIFGILFVLCQMYITRLVQRFCTRIRSLDAAMQS